METYNQTQLRNILKDEISSKRLQVLLPLLLGMLIALVVLIFSLKSLSANMLILEFIVVTLGAGTLLWNFYYERKHAEENEKIEKLLQQIANDE